MYTHRLQWLLVIGIAACGGDRAPDAAAAPAPTIADVRFTASDFAFQGPSTIEAGMVTFTLTNESPTPHHLQLVRLPDGMSFDQFTQALAAIHPGAPPPAWIRDAGGVNPPAQGKQARVTLAIEPGEYAVLCFVDIPDHIPHVAKGMIQPLTVTPASGPVAPLPEADLSLSLVDYAFGFSAPPSRGTHIVRVRNDAQQSHEIAVMRLLPGKTMDDFAAWGATYEGPPPITMVGGVPAMYPGQSANIELTLEPGDYVAVCFIPDATDGAPHLVHGMLLPFSIS